MVKLLKIILAGILTSFFFFPFEFTFLPGINVKMMLAVVGLICVAYHLIVQRSISVSYELIILILFALAVSCTSLLSMVINQTPDNTYASYIISFSVWLSAAYAVCSCVKSAHGKIDIPLIINYLSVVCVIQCISALVIDSSPAIAKFVNTYMLFGQEVTIKTKRLYGLGALLDVAGARFSTVLVGLSFLLSEINTPLNLWQRAWYILAFILISIIGNIIARTTVVGMGIGIAFIILALLFSPSNSNAKVKTQTVLSWTLILALSVLVCTVLYNENANARKLLRFGFEGFFSLVEKGKWDVSSNEKLQTMIVFPETLHTWIIGDGYFLNSRYDPNYLGDATDMGFYMGTDIGYLRFIFYFGVTGLIPMMGVIIYSAIVCMRHFREEWLLFLLALAVGLTVWFKVSTDIFLFFALFLSAAALQDTPEE